MLTKSDYLKYTQCYKYLWLYKFRKDLLPKELSLAVERVFDEGYHVESYAYKLFPDGIDADDEDFSKAISKTKELMKSGKGTIFQPTVSKNNLFCRADIIKYNSRTKKWDIYEVKSSTQVNDIHLLDLAFQKICFEAAEYNIGKLHLVHVNSNYVRQGNIEPEKLLSIDDATRQVETLIEKVKIDIKEAHKILDLKSEPHIKILKQCYAPYACHFMDYCWRHVPDDSIYAIAGGLSEEKLEMLLDQGIIKIEDIPDGIITNKRGIRHHNAIKTSEVFIDHKAIAKELSQLEYPLYFLDYETNSPAVPLFDGYKPYQRIVFQYSLHVKKTPSAKLDHYAFLHNEFSDPTKALVDSLKKIIGGKGSVIAWNKVFEMGCNKEMGERHKASRPFMKSINDRMYDLMNTFRHGYYVHKDFHGSASIKKVLPVLVPKLSYSELDIREGGTASESWRVMIDPNTGKKESGKIYNDLLKYCRLDTLAMVEILKVLNDTVK